MSSSVADQSDSVDFDFEVHLCHVLFVHTTSLYITFVTTVASIYSRRTELQPHLLQWCRHWKKDNECFLKEKYQKSYFHIKNNDRSNSNNTHTIRTAKYNIDDHATPSCAVVDVFDQFKCFTFLCRLFFSCPSSLLFFIEFSRSLTSAFSRHVYEIVAVFFLYF